MKKIFYFLCLIFTSKATFADVVVKSPDAREWAEKLQKNSLRTIKAPMRVIFAEKIIDPKSKKKKIKAIEFNGKLCGEISYISCVSGNDFNYALKLNKVSGQLSFEKMMSYSRSNAVVYADSGRVFLRVTGEPDVMSLPALQNITTGVDGKLVIDKLLAVLGYDGVILDIQNEYLLIGTLNARLKEKEQQALVVRDSANMFTIKPQSAKDGAALISLVNQYGGYGVFKTVLAQNITPLIPGQKVVMEGSTDRDTDSKQNVEPQSNQSDSREAKSPSSAE